MRAVDAANTAVISVTRNAIRTGTPFLIGLTSIAAKSKQSHGDRAALTATRKIVMKGTYWFGCPRSYSGRPVDRIAAQSATKTASLPASSLELLVEYLDHGRDAPDGVTPSGLRFTT